MLVLLDQMNERVNELTAAVQQEAEKRLEAQLLMTHPGVGPVTALAFVLIVGYPERFHVGNKSEATSGSSQPNPPAAFIDGWGTSASRVTFFYVLSWWKQHKLR